MTWFVAPKKPLEMTVVLKKSARERRRCCELSIYSSHFLRPDWFPAYRVSS